MKVVVIFPACAYLFVCLFCLYVYVCGGDISSEDSRFFILVFVCLFVLIKEKWWKWL